MRLKATVTVAMTLLLLANGLTRGEPAMSNTIQQVAEDLPLLSPDLIWERQLPGRRRAEPHRPNAPVDTELNSAIKSLAAGWSLRGHQTDWTGTPGLITHLSPPGAAPRAVFWFTDGHLYLVEKSPLEWLTRRITDVPVDIASVVDLSGDGQPEIVAAAQYGSGGVLALRVFTWNPQRVWVAFSHTGAQEPGLFGWCDADDDGARELWIDTSVARGLFTGTTHGPFFRDRLLFRWDEGTYKQIGKYRLATPFYHLNRYLYFASKQDWQSATRHIEPGVEMDRRLTKELGLGPFLGGSDVPFVNGRMYFSKGGQDYFADFGRTGRLVGLGKGEPPSGR